MMASYRADGRRTRIGALIATALVGTGLLLTASGGIAAETTKSVETKMRTVLGRTTPTARVTDAPAPIAAPAAPDAPWAPAAPQPPAPPQPGKAHATAFRFDHAGMHESLSAIGAEAAAEARAAVAAAMAETHAGDAHRIAWTEVHARMPEIRAEVARARAEAARAGHEGHQIVMNNCGKRNAVVMRSDAPGQRTLVVRCGDQLSAEDRAEMRAEMIQSLEEARSNLAENLSDDWARKARETALAAIDQKLEELRAQK
jgi:hypothetical protein